MDESPRMIHLENISKEYDGVTVLSNINLYIRKKEFVTLLARPAAVKPLRFALLAALNIPLPVR